MGVKSNTNYYSNAIVGTPRIGAGIDIHRVDSDAKFPLGYGFERADGAKFRYSQAGASDCNRGIVVCPGGTVTEGGGQIVDVDQDVWANTQTTAPNGATCAEPNKAGSYYVWVTLSNVSDHQLAGGYLVITDDTGEGYTYRVKDNDTTGDAQSGVVQLELYEPLVQALGTTSDYAIAPCKYADLVPAVDPSITAAAFAVGVTCASITANNYGWVQTKGPCGVLTGAQVPRQGDEVCLDSDDAGAVCTKTYTGANMAEQVVGVCLIPGDDTGHSIVDLKLE